MSTDLLSEKKMSIRMKWFVFWDLKIRHQTVNNGDGDRKAGKGNKAETMMRNNKMRRMSESVQTGSNSGYTECKESFSTACDGAEVFSVVYLSIFCLLFYGWKTFFFFLHFPLLN